MYARLVTGMYCPGQSWFICIESAIKMNDQYWGNPENYIVTFTPSFHGTTFLCRAMGDDDNYVKRIKKVPTPLWKKKEDQISAERKSFKYLASYSRHIGVR